MLSSPRRSPEAEAAGELVVGAVGTAEVILLLSLWRKYRLHPSDLRY